ncbi:la-related protein 6-like [Melanerpes formicivorus]|uniref:la-related protein 6-like n=1 Tax=Melanerpes formicivorus TaxID=211600 RepID=UPI00358E1F69
MLPAQSSQGALGLPAQPSRSSPVPSVPALHLLPARSRPLALLGHDHRRSLSRGFGDGGNARGADAGNSKYSTTDLQLVQNIVSQVEFYLSDENLAKDAFLLKHVQKNKMGFVSIKLLTSFKKVKYLTRDWRLTLYALRFSELLEVNEAGTKVRRRIPIPESLLSVPPSKLLLAWDLLPQEQGVLPLFQRRFLETITRVFSPFGPIASIRILRPGRKPPSDVRNLLQLFPEMLSKCCALVEYESLESARRALEDLGRRGYPGGQSIRVVQLCGKGFKKKPGAERETPAEEQLGWKMPAAGRTYDSGDSLFCSSLGSDSALQLSPPTLSRDPPAPTWPGDDFQPRSVSGSLFSSSKAFPQLWTGWGSSGAESGSGWGSIWAPWSSSSPLDAKPSPGRPPAVKQAPEPLGPDGTKGFYSSLGRGGLPLRR